MECLRKIYRIFLYIYLFLLKNTSNNIFLSNHFSFHSLQSHFASINPRFFFLLRNIGLIFPRSFALVYIYIFFNLFQNKSLFFLLYPLGKIFTNFRIFTQTKHHIWKHMCRASIWQSIYIYIAINLTLWRKV